MASPTPQPRPGRRAALNNFLRAPRGDKRLAAEAAACLILARLLIVFVPLRRWNASAHVGRADMSAASADPAALERARRIGRIVRLTARRMPFKALCLTQAVAGQWMLRRRGLSGEIRLGARKPAPDRPMELHAWLTVGEAVLTGGAQARAFTPLKPAGRVASRRSEHDRAG